jgi:hypothetical protein
LGADFLRFLVVVVFLAYVFIGVSYATMGPQAFFEDYVQRTFRQLINLLAMKGSGGGLDKVD